MSHCPMQCSTCRVEEKRDAKMRKSMISQINACQSGAFLKMVEEDKDESPHVNTDETDEEAQDRCLALDDDLDSDVNNIIIEEGDHIFMKPKDFHDIVPMSLHAYADVFDINL
jgi:hypothetical protein